MPVKYMNVYLVGTGKEPKVFAGGCLCDTIAECEKKTTKPVYAIATVEFVNPVDLKKLQTTPQEKEDFLNKCVACLESKNDN